MDSFLKNTQQCLDSILDLPPDQWGDREIQVFQLLKGTVDKYQSRHAQVQFCLDLKEIKTNVHQQEWYRKSPYQSALDWYLEQLEITSFGHSSHDHYFKLVALFKKIQVKLTIYHRQKLQIILENSEMKSDLSQPDKLNQLFGLSELDLDTKGKKRLLYDLNNLVTEIALYYQS